MTHLRTSIEYEGQPFVDEPILVQPKQPSLIEDSLNDMFGKARKKAITVGHDRVKLRWMTPDGNGGLVPR